MFSDDESSIFSKKKSIFSNSSIFSSDSAFSEKRSIGEREE